MNNLAVARETFREISVVAAATGGVEGNAARVGDPASCHEYDGRHTAIVREAPPAFGTINVMIVVNQPMLDGALVRAVMTATEAKTAALQELSVPSRYSAELATGTGTDQNAVCAPVSGDALPLRGAGHHTTAGEPIGKAVKRAIKETPDLPEQPAPDRAVLLHPPDGTLRPGRHRPDRGRVAAVARSDPRRRAPGSARLRPRPDDRAGRRRVFACSRPTELGPRLRTH